MSKIEDLSMKQHVYEYIRDKILTLELEPGERIPESQIAADLGISRTPVREAVRLLSWEGLITIRPNHSATVVVLDDKKVQDLLLVRWQHDALAVPLAIYNGSRREFEELRKTAKECIEANNRGNLWCRHELDSKFHRDIVKTSQNEILVDIYTRVSLVIRLWQALHITEQSTLEEGLLQHLELVDCLENRDTERALQILRNHYSQSYGISLENSLPHIFHPVSADPAF